MASAPWDKEFINEGQLYALAVPLQFACRKQSIDYLRCKTKHDNPEECKAFAEENFNCTVNLHRKLQEQSAEYVTYGDCLTNRSMRDHECKEQKRNWYEWVRQNANLDATNF